jgi:hypothetical protein
MTSKRIAAVVVLALAGIAGPAQQKPAEKLIARTFDSGFAQSHDTYNSISVASDGKVHYVLSTETLDAGTRM